MNSQKEAEKFHSLFYGLGKESLPAAVIASKVLFQVTSDDDQLPPNASINKFCSDYWKEINAFLLTQYMRTPPRKTTRKIKPSKK